MTQQEFTQRTGLTPTAEEFATIHRIYMACATLDKDEFCRDYKKHGMSRIITELLDNIISEERKVDNIYTQYTELEHKTNEGNFKLAQFLLGKAAVYNDPDFEDEALKLISRSTVILIKAKNGYPMTADDLAYIAKNLK